MIYYKNFAISLDEKTGVFSCWELDVSSTSLKEIHTAINAATKKEKENIERIKILLFGEGRHSEGFIEGTAGKKENKYGYTYYWVHFGKGKHRKESASYIYLDTPENRDILSRVIQLRKKAEEIERDANSLLDTVERIPSDPSE